MGTTKNLNYKDIGYRIKALRMKQGISQTDFAKTIEVSQTHMSNIEGGKAGLTLENLVKMVNIFDCSLDYLVFGDDTPKLANNSDAFKNCTVEDFLKAIEMLKALKQQRKASCAAVT